MNNLLRLNQVHRDGYGLANPGSLIIPATLTAALATPATNIDWIQAKC